MKKKYKFKKKFIISFLLLLILVTASLIYIFVINKPKEEKKEPIKEEKEVIIIDYVKKINEKTSLDTKFLKWIEDNYKDSLINLDKILEEKEYSDTLWHDVTGYSYKVLKDLYADKYKDMSNIKVLESKDIAKIDFTGDISLSDDWYVGQAYTSRNKKVYGILSEDTVKIMNDSDFMVVNSEFTVSNRGTKMAGKQYTFRAKPERLNIYHEMGVDLALLANNHVYDYGKDAFLDMLDHFKEYNIPYIGAGKNFEEAKSAYYIILNGYKIAFLNATRAEKYIMTPEATDTNPGVFRCYDTTNLINEIKKAKEESDFVITIVHFGTEFSHSLEEAQTSSARSYIDAGSDMVVGHHAHVLQGVEIYNDKPIIYNLGNFIFNGATVDTAIYEVRLDKNGNMEYYIIPHIQSNVYTSLADESNKQRIIKDMNSWSINASIDNNGKITKK